MPTTPDLQGKSIIVTGAGSGLGKAMALGLVHAGASVLGVDLDGTNAQQTAREAKSSRAYGTLLPFACDVRSQTSCIADGRIRFANGPAFGTTSAGAVCLTA